LTVGRDEGNDVVLGDDHTVSRLHAVVERLGPGWCLRDAGSANGTHVNGERLNSERLLQSGDELGIGETRIVYRSSEVRPSRPTVTAESPPVLTRRERDVLVALCSPLRSGEPFAQPASIAALAKQLFVSEAAVKFHLGNLYDKFGVQEGDVPRRVRLANEAVRRRAVTITELDG
jgi:pSer/pThr/pTyr-binding forkhead associated (FHA) protein